MPKILYIQSKNHFFTKNIKCLFGKISDQLNPDNINNESDYSIYYNKNTAYLITPNSEGCDIDQGSVLMGFLYESENYQWNVPTSNMPDGNYAIFRANGKKLEILTDIVGSRTVWYFQNDHYFIASTSQRSIIMFLGEFHFDKRVIPWMLSSGTLGPEFSWDKRIKRLQANSSLILDKDSWEYIVKRVPAVFSYKKESKRILKKKLENSIISSIEKLSLLNYNNWLVPLSGGYDSRAILYYLKQQNLRSDDLKTITWGVESSLNENYNDAKIASDLAKKLNVTHEYLLTEKTTEPIEAIIHRYLLTSEGRIDHISAYMDGLKIWKLFYEENVFGIIRGDEGFGWLEVNSEQDVRLKTGCALYSDFGNLDKLLSYNEYGGQVLPDFLQRREDESLSTWRDRLYHEFRLPTILSALSDIKYSYVEVINPLLSKKVIDTVRVLPDSYRTKKKIFKEIVDKITPDIPYAKISATKNHEDILKEKKVVELIKNEIINSDFDIFDNTLLKEHVIKNMEYIQENSSINKSIWLKKMLKSTKNSIPGFIKSLIRKYAVSPEVDNNALAFRLFLIIRMNKILQIDAESLNKGE